MRKLAIACQKGGVGKSTLTTNLAVLAARDGYAVAVADLDQQATSTFWHDTRGKDDVAVQPIFATLLKSRLRALDLAGCDLAVIDTPPHAKDIASTAIAEADFVLIPVKPAVFDLNAMLVTIDQCKALAKPFAVVLNCCPPYHGEELERSMEAIATSQTEICPVLLHQYVVYPRSQTAGLAVCELDPESKAAHELKRLYRHTLKHLDMPPRARGARRQAA